MDNISKYWDGSKDEFSNRETDDTLVGFKELKYILRGSRKILDIGCGIGNIVSFLNSQGYDATGITYQKREVEYAESIGRKNIVHGDMHELPFEDNTFDTFIMWDSLEHAVAPYIALQEAKRVTKDKGRGCIFIPGQRWIECEYHIIVPSVRQMKHLLRLVGLELEVLVDYWGEEQAAYFLTVNK